MNKWKKKGALSFATWNVQGISFKEDQLDDILAKKGIKIAAISETKKKLKGSKETIIFNYITVSAEQRGPKLESCL
jgi:exonuclease III